MTSQEKKDDKITEEEEEDRKNGLCLMAGDKRFSFTKVGAERRQLA